MFHAKHFALPAAFRSGDYVRVGAVLDRMAWFGRDISSFRRAAANELITQKRYLDGLRQWERAVDLQGGDVVTHEELANFAMRYGDAEAAIRQNREVLRLEPSRVKARNDLAWLLSTSEEETIREPGEAVRLAESLVREQTQPDPNLLDTLAAAYAASGRYGEAIETARRAEQLASERDDVWLAEDIHDRIVLYRSEQPYIQRRDPQG